MCANMPPLELAIQFHGHICPGLLMGVRAAEFALEKLQVSRDMDEELLAVVETDSCGVDAIQSILGCTLGKGNLIVKDYGKAVYTIASRDQKKAIRIAQRFNALRTPLMDSYRQSKNQLNPTDEQKEASELLLSQVFEFIMTSPFEDLFKCEEVDFDFPPQAQIHQTLQCSVCGEGVMKTRASVNGKEILCPTCKIASGGKA